MSAAATRTFYSISPDIDPRTGQSRRTGKYFPPWISQIGSLDRAKVTAYDYLFTKKGESVTHYIDVIEVPCLTVGALLRAEQLAPERVAAMLIDTQGADGVILRSIDFAAERLRPAFLIYEHLMLSPPERHQTLAHLWKHGYSCNRWDGGNTWCVPLANLPG